MIIGWDEIRPAGLGPWVGISHPDGRKVLTDELDDPIIKVQRRINKRKLDGDPLKPPDPADYALIAAWLDRNGGKP